MYDASGAHGLDQGTILKEAPFYAIAERREAIVVTPVCDIAQDKADYVAFCALFKLSEFLEGQLAGGWSSGGKLDANGKFPDSLPKNEKNGFRKDTRNKLEQIARGSFPRYYWLQPWDDGEPRVADLALVQTVTLEEAIVHEMLVHLQTPYRELVSTRYAAHMGRVGVPDPEDGEKKQTAETIQAIVEAALGAPEA